jgi:hypothetical protein
MIKILKRICNNIKLKYRMLIQLKLNEKNTFKKITEILRHLKENLKKLKKNFSMSKKFVTFSYTIYSFFERIYIKIMLPINIFKYKYFSFRKNIKHFLDNFGDNAIVFNDGKTTNIPRISLNIIELLKGPLYKNPPSEYSIWKRILWYIYGYIGLFICFLFPSLITISLTLLYIYLIVFCYANLKVFERWLYDLDPEGTAFTVFCVGSFLIMFFSYVTYYIFKKVDLKRESWEDPDQPPLTLFVTFNRILIEAGKNLLCWMEKRAQENERRMEEKKIEKKLWLEKKRLEIKIRKDLEQEKDKIREREYLEKINNKGLTYKISKIKDKISKIKDKIYKKKDPMGSILAYLIIYYILRELLKTMTEAQRYDECSAKCFVEGCKCPAEDFCDCYDSCVIKCMFHKHHEPLAMLIEMLPSVEETQSSFSIFFDLFLIHFPILLLILFLYGFLKHKAK